jgi:hypothetical protein
MFCKHLAYDKFDLMRDRRVRTYCQAFDKPCRQVKPMDCPNTKAMR